MFPQFNLLPVPYLISFFVKGAWKLVCTKIGVEMNGNGIERKKYDIP